MCAALPETATGIADAVRSGAVSATQVVQAALERVASRDGKIGAFTTLLADRALAEAAAVDRARQEGKALGPLAGVPYAVKNLYDIAGVTTLAGSKIRRQQPTAESDAVLIRRMQAAGAVLLGGLNMGEFAYDFTGEN